MSVAELRAVRVSQLFGVAVQNGTLNTRTGAVTFAGAGGRVTYASAGAWKLHRLGEK